MLVEVQLPIAADSAAVWAVIADIERGAEYIRGIERIEILERPERGLIGLKWRETRILFGKPASVDKWITASVEGRSYQTRAESDGFVFVSTMSIADAAIGVTLSSVHDSLPQTWSTRCMVIPMALFFKGVARKALMADLADIKAAAERAVASA